MVAQTSRTRMAVALFLLDGAKKGSVALNQPHAQHVAMVNTKITMEIEIVGTVFRIQFIVVVLILAFATKATAGMWLDHHQRVLPRMEEDVRAQGLSNMATAVLILQITEFRLRLTAPIMLSVVTLSTGN